MKKLEKYQVSKLQIINNIKGANFAVFVRIRNEFTHQLCIQDSFFFFLIEWDAFGNFRKVHLYNIGKKPPTKL